MRQKRSIFQVIFTAIIAGITFLVPLFFLPIFTDAYELPKYIAVTIATTALIITWITYILKRRQIAFTITPFTVPLFLYVLANVASLLIANPNKWMPLILPNGVGTVIVLFFWFLFVSFATQRNQKLSEIVINAFIISSATAAIFSLLGITGILNRIPLDVFKGTFTPAGSPIMMITILIPACILAITPFLYKQLVAEKSTNQEKIALKPVSITAAAILLLGISGSIFAINTSAKPILLPHWAGWIISVDTLKDIKSSLVGVGSLNYISAFTQSRPVAMNNLETWNLRFSAASNFYFQILTETGVLSLVAFALFIFQLIRTGYLFIVKYHESVTPYLWGILSILIIQIFVPTNFVLLFLIFTLAGLLGPQLYGSWDIEEESFVVPVIIAFLGTIIIFITAYFFGRMILSEFIFKQAIDAIRSNKAQEAYNKNINALELNQNNDIFHLTYSQTNIAIANSMAQQKNITDTQRQTISQLIQQAIREGKSAVAANPTKASNWENLANIYRNIMNVAQGADNWTVQVYQQAIRLDPTNPQLRLNLGGVYFNLNRMDEAIEQFKLSVSLKQDFANGYYNLAAAFREKGDIANATAALKQAIEHVPANNPDFEKARKELADLEKQLPEKTASESGSILNLPATGSAKIKPPLSLPTESAPPKEKATKSQPTTTPVAASATPVEPTPTM